MLELIKLAVSQISIICTIPVLSFIVDANHSKATTIDSLTINQSSKTQISKIQTVSKNKKAANLKGLIKILNRKVSQDNSTSTSEFKTLQKFGNGQNKAQRKFTQHRFPQPKFVEVHPRLNRVNSPHGQVIFSDKSTIESNTKVNESIKPNSNQKLADNPMGQVNSVSQFADIQPTDWAFQALQSLVERYGCIAGYPNGRFSGDRAMTRYEFAAGLNSCIDRINELIRVATAELVNREDLATLKRLETDFKTELTSLRSRVDSLEARTSNLEANQFSITTKLLGNVNLQTNAYFSGDGDPQTNIQHLTFLGLMTSFTGRDLLLTGIATTNTTFPEIATTNNGRDVGGTREGASANSSPGDQNNSFRIVGLEYQFPVGDNLIIDLIGANRYRFNTTQLKKYAPYYVRGLGPVSTFATAPPMFLIGGGSGLSARYKLLDSTTINLSYIASPGSVSSLGGLFKGDYIAAAEINYNPNPGLFLQFAYQHGYFGPGNFGFNNGQSFRGNGFVGTALANRFDDAGVLFEDASAVSTNGYLVGGYFAISPKVAIGGWANLIKARLHGRGDADIWSYSLQAAFPDLFKKGNHGGLIIGMEPSLTGLKSNLPRAEFKNDTSLHIEAYYTHQISNQISIAPSITWITAPNQDADNEDIVIGGLRTTFNF
ncbi:MAG: iron uptake porin [Calothrix sp. MO_167.B42]|nr:iron uptake porin [Calothrix sp. MO_167.B42]